MTDTLTTTEIKRRSAQGAKWLILTNALGMPAGYVIALLLGRVGPEALGTYALAQILLGVITTFVVYGGPPVLSVFMPKVKDASDRGRFLFTYLLILLTMMAFALGVFWLFPGVFRFLLQRDFDMRHYGWFVLLAAVVVVSESLTSAASGLMHIQLVAVARLLVRATLLPLVAILFFWNRQILIDHGMECILGGFLVAHLLAALYCATGIARDERFSMRPGWFLPRGFWAFSASTMLATVFTFLYGNFDRMCVLSIQDLDGLGMYQAAISISSLISLLPHALGTAVIPTFSSLLATGNVELVRRAYSFVQRVGSICMCLVALLLIACGPELLSLFGKSYTGVSYLLSLFCIQSAITSPYFGNTPILMAYQRNAFRLTVSSFQIAIQVIGTLAFMGAFGVLAVATAKFTGAIIAQLVCTYYVLYRLPTGFRLPRSYGAGIAATLLCATLKHLMLPTGWIPSILVFMAVSVMYLIASGVNRADVQRLTAAVLNRGGSLTGS